MLLHTLSHSFHAECNSHADEYNPILKKLMKRNENVEEDEGCEPKTFLYSMVQKALFVGGTFLSNKRKMCL